MPLILSHRGANRLAPQNTLPAFQKAVELAADGIETDVHLTKDGKIVICHNYEVDETSNGTGKIADMTFDELRALDFGSYFGEAFRGVTLPTMRELFGVVGGMTLINIEIKAPQTENDLVKRVVEEIYDFGLQDKVIVSCFDPECLRRTKELAPGLATGLLYETGDLGSEIMSFGVVNYCKQLRAQAAHPEHILLTEELVRELHDNGLKVHPWTVNDEQDIIRLTDWGCDALITNVPDFCREVINNR